MTLFKTTLLAALFASSQLIAGSSSDPLKLIEQLDKSSGQAQDATIKAECLSSVGVASSDWIVDVSDSRWSQCADILQRIATSCGKDNTNLYAGSVCRMCESQRELAILTFQQIAACEIGSEVAKKLEPLLGQSAANISRNLGDSARIATSTLSTVNEHIRKCGQLKIKR